MTHQPRSIEADDPVRQLGQLRRVLRLVENVAGLDPSPETEAQASRQLGDAMPVVQRRFNALAAEAATWTAIGAAALAGTNGAADAPLCASTAAAARLAEELRDAIRELERLLPR